jgi:hypothetical protein
VSNRGHGWGVDGFSANVASVGYDSQSGLTHSTYADQARGQLADLKEASIAPFTAAGVLYGLGAVGLSQLEYGEGVWSFHPSGLTLRQVTICAVRSPLDIRGFTTTTGMVPKLSKMVTEYIRK